MPPSDSMGAPRIDFDARPLTEPVDRRAVREHLKALRAQGRAPEKSTASAVSTVLVTIVSVVVGCVALVTVGRAVVSATAGGQGFSAVLAVLPALLVLGGVVLGVVSLVRAWKNPGERWLRLDRFARANHMNFVPSLPAPQLPGMIFGQGAGRTALDLVRGSSPRFVEFGNYQYTTGSGEDRTTHRWGYVAVRLDVPLPHIVLDAVSSTGTLGTSSLPTAFQRTQRLRLEGDFDRFFALYCPVGYERDALYLFTPDIMARFIDNVAELDVEIVDDWLFLYSRRDLSTLDPATWAWLFSVVSALLDKLAQWGRWRDERLPGTQTPTPTAGALDSGIPGARSLAAAPPMTPPPGVAPPGQRLRRRFRWVPILIFGVLLLVFTLWPLGIWALIFAN